MTSDPDRRSKALNRQVAWVVAHPASARAMSDARRISTLAMATTFALGLVVHIAGYGIGTRAIPMPDWLPADLASTLVSNLGIVLWTSVILVVFLEILPARTRRRAARSMSLAATALRDEGRAVPRELEDIGDPDDDEAHRTDRTLEAVLERLAAIERHLIDGGGGRPARPGQIE
jgi:hypothetical protein